MLRNKVIFNKMLVNMAKQLRVPIDEDCGTYRIYKNEQERLHGKVRFQGNADDTYKKLLEIDQWQRSR